MRRPTPADEAPASEAPPSPVTPQAVPPQEPPPRGSGRLLLDRLYGPFWAGKLLSTAGIWVHNVVSAIVTYQISRSTLMVGAVSIVQFAPQLLFAPISGAQADRGDPRRQLVLGRLLAASGSLGLAGAIAVLGVDGLPGAWPLLIAAAIVGVGFVVGGPAMHALLPTLVRPNELPAAVALSHLPPTLARSGGPVLGAFLLVTVGPAWAFAFTGITNLVFAAVIVALPIRWRAREQQPGGGTVREGLRYLRSDPAVAFLLLGVLALGFGADPVVTLTPELSDGFGRGEQLVGIFASAFGLGAAVVFPLLKVLRARVGLSHLGTLGLSCVAGGLFVTAAAPVPAVAIVGMALGGVGFSFALTGLTTALYEQVPEGFRGRIMALWSMAFLGSRPVAAAVNGGVADLTSVAGAFLAAGGVVVVIAVIGGRRAGGRAAATAR